MGRSGWIRIALFAAVLALGYQLLRERQAIQMRHEIVAAAYEQVARAVQELLRDSEEMLLDPRVQSGTSGSELRDAVASLETTVQSARKQLPEAALVPATAEQPGATFLEIEEAPFPAVPVLQQIADSLTVAALDVAESLADPQRREAVLDQRAQVLLMAARHHAQELELQQYLRRPLPSAVAALMEMGKSTRGSDD